MSFIKFRNGNPISLSSGESVSYEFLKEQGFNDHQSRAVYLNVQEENVDISTLNEWIADLKDPKRRTKRQQELSKIIAKSHASTLPPSSRQAIKTTRVRKVKTKTFTLYSRSNHTEAKKEAQKRGLAPQSVAGKKFPTNVSPEAFSVSADEKTASSLITTGYWMTA